MILCEGCRVQRKPRYEGSKLILEKVTCLCSCVEVVYGPRGAACVKCEHTIKDIPVFEDPEGWEGPYFRDGTGHPIRVDSIVPSSRRDSTR
jgi:hypothetical protein